MGQVATSKRPIQRSLYLQVSFAFALGILLGYRETEADEPELVLDATIANPAA